MWLCSRIWLGFSLNCAFDWGWYFRGVMLKFNVRAFLAEYFYRVWEKILMLWIISRFCVVVLYHFRFRRDRWWRAVICVDGGNRCSDEWISWVCHWWRVLREVSEYFHSEIVQFRKEDSPASNRNSFENIKSRTSRRQHQPFNLGMPMHFLDVLLALMHKQKLWGHFRFLAVAFFLHCQVPLKF